MSHHGSEPNPAMQGAMCKLFGEYPNGKLNENDAGALAVEIGTENDRVVIRFPKPVAWIGFTGDQAMEIAQTLMKHARRAGITAPVVLRIGEG
jgi:hypothetical protein